LSCGYLSGLNSLKIDWASFLGWMRHEMLLEKGLARYSLFLSTLSVLVCSITACALRQASHTEYVNDMGRFEYRSPENGMSGIIVGASHGNSEPSSADYARWISKRTGAGLVIAYGFAAKRISVTQAIVGFYPVSTASAQALPSGSVFPVFKNLLTQTVGGDLRLYLGIRFAAEETDSRQIDVVTSGLTVEEINFLIESYARIRDQVITDSKVPKVDLAAESFDKLLWTLSGIKHHGVLMMAKRGLSLRLPRVLRDGAAGDVYREVLSLWVTHALPAIMENFSGLPHMAVRVLEQGRIETIPSRQHRCGVVIAAPHGTFDEYTAEVVKQISFRTGISAVIAKGFTPTEGEAGGLTRIGPPKNTIPAVNLRSHPAEQKRFMIASKKSCLMRPKESWNCTSMSTKMAGKKILRLRPWGFRANTHARSKKCTEKYEIEV